MTIEKRISSTSTHVSPSGKAYMRLYKVLYKLNLHDKLRCTFYGTKTIVYKTIECMHNRYSEHYSNEIEEGLVHESDFMFW